MTSIRTVLVVEDNPLTRKMLRVTLEMEGYSVIEAEDGRTALAAATAEMPDLVLQDLILPDMNGFELVRMLRALPGGADAPILALSGFLSRIEEARTPSGVHGPVGEARRALTSGRYCPGLLPSLPP